MTFFGVSTRSDSHKALFWVFDRQYGSFFSPSLMLISGLLSCPDAAYDSGALELCHFRGGPIHVCHYLYCYLLVKKAVKNLKGT